MKKLLLVIAAAALFACNAVDRLDQEEQVAKAGQDTRAAGQIEVTEVAIDTQMQFTGISSSQAAGASYMVAVGMGKDIFYSHDGINWAISEWWADTPDYVSGVSLGTYRTARFGAIVTNRGIGLGAGSGEGWSYILDDNTFAGTAINRLMDSHGYQTKWIASGLSPDRRVKIYSYYIFDNGMSQYQGLSEFEEHDIVWPVTAISEGRQYPNVIVTQGGEIAIVNFSSRIEIIDRIPVSLTAVVSDLIYYYPEEDYGLFIGGKRGYFARAKWSQGGGPYPHGYESVSTGLSGTITAIATNGDLYSDPENRPPHILVLTTDRGEALYSLDKGTTFESFDIGSGSDVVRSITYYDPDACFFAVGDNGKMWRIKVHI